MLWICSIKIDRGWRIDMKGRFFFDGWLGRAANLYGLWPLIPATVNTAITGILASTSDYVSQLGPLAWWGLSLLIGALTYLLIVTGGLLTEIARSKKVYRELAERTASASQINPLSNRFFQQRILLNVFHDPFGDPIKDRAFEECDLIGPATIVIVGRHSFSENSLQNVEFAKIDDDKIRGIPNKLIIQDGQIRRCKVSNVIFLVPNSAVTMFEQGFGGNVLWLN